MRGQQTTPRLAALIAAAALAVHQLRYLIAPVGAGEPTAGHTYLPFAALLAVAALAAVSAQLLRRLAQARGGAAAPERRPLSFRRAWLLAAVALIAIFATQELLEGALSAGRYTGLGAVLGHGAWVAIPCSLVLALLVAFVAVGVQRLIAAATRRRVSPPRGARRLGRPRSARRPLHSVLAANVRGRAPPLLA